MVRSLMIALSCGVLRLVSWLYTAKCLTSEITSWAWMPRISAAASAPLRYGSSVSASKLRPQRGSR